MIKVVMRDKHCGKRVMVKAMLGQCFLQPAQAYTGIDEYAGCFSTEVIAVAAAPARKAHEPDHQQCPSILAVCKRISASRSVPGS